VAERLFSECFADGMQIDQVNFMKGCDVIDGIPERSHLREGNRFCGVDGNVDIGMRPGGAFRPRSEPDDLDVVAENVSGQSCDLFRNQFRLEYEVLLEHGLSVLVLAVKSTTLHSEEAVICAGAHARSIIVMPRWCYAVSRQEHVG